MKKKVLSLLVSGVFALSMLAGCGQAAAGGDSGTQSADAETSEAQAEESAAADEAASDAAGNGEEVTLTVWCWDPAYNINAMEVAEGIYQEKNPNFHLDIQEINTQDIFAKIATATSSGDLSSLPDIFLMDDANIAAGLVAYPEIFTDISDYGFNYDDFAESKVASSMSDGKHYGIPFDSGTAIAAYRTDILEEAGYTIEDLTDITWSRFIEIGTDVLDKTGVPLLNGMGAGNQIALMLKSAGATYTDDEGKPNLNNNDAIKEIIEIYTDMVNEGVFTEETAWDTYIGGLNTGRIGGAMNGCWIMSSITAADDQSGKWAITNIPKLENVSGATNYSSQGGSSWIITSNCQNIETAIDFFNTTYAGSTEFYDNILSTGAIATWLPAAESSVYQEPVAYFGDQPVYAMITEYSAEVPATATSVVAGYANQDLVNAVTNVLYSGYTVQDALDAAQENLLFELEQ